MSKANISINRDVFTCPQCTSPAVITRFKKQTRCNTEVSLVCNSPRCYFQWVSQITAVRALSAQEGAKVRLPHFRERLC